MSSRRWALLSAIGISFVFFWAYSLAASMPWMYDDIPNLEGLFRIQQPTDLFQYVINGVSSTIGRPLSLITFVFNRSDWPDNPAGFRYINTSLHFFNGILVFAIAYRITGLSHHLKDRRVAVSMSMATFWLLQPFLASSVLSVVQRMTLLSGTFVLCGTLGYVHGRIIVQKEPRLGTLIVLFSLVFGTIFATLSKENGILLPLFAATLEYFLLSKLLPRTSSLIARSAAPTLALVVIAAFACYTVISWQGSLGVYAFRDFSPEQRVATEAVILWKYIGQIILPNISTMGLFQDDTTIYSFSQSIPAISLSLWTVLIFCSIIWKRPAPLLGVAVFGFLSGHIIESTVLPLELYFEHRNYLPSLFIAGPLVSSIWLIPGRIPGLISTGISLTFGVLLTSLTSLWGNTSIAAQRWHDAHPDSSRAAQFAANISLQGGDAELAYRTLSSTLTRNPLAADLIIQATMMRCRNDRPQENLEAWNEAVSHLRTGKFSFATFSALTQYADLIEKSVCSGLEKRHIEQLWLTLLENRKYAASQLARDFIYNALARMASERGEFNKAVEFEKHAYGAAPTTQNLILVTTYLIQQGQIDDARSFFEDKRRVDMPTLPWRKALWLKQLESFDDFLDRLGESASVPESI